MGHVPMTPYDVILNKLRKIGYSDDLNISDYWFENRDRLIRKIFGNVHTEEFCLKVRWKSQMGISCQEALILFLKRKMDEHRDEVDKYFSSDYFSKVITDKTYKHKSFGALKPYKRIDFSDFSFDFNGKSFTLDDFEYHFPLAREGFVNLGGIDLSGINLRDCEFVNVSFAHSDFDNSTLSQIKFTNCSFCYITARKAHLDLRIDDKTIISGKFQESYIHIYPFEDRILSSPFEISKISYISLLKLSAYRLLNINFYLGGEKWKFTKLSLETTKLNRSENSAIKNYIDWYKGCISKPRNTTKERIAFFLSCLLTKHWTSYVALLFWFFIANLAFGFFIFLSPEHFEKSEKLYSPGFVEAIYSAIMTFSFLGGGDIQPADSVGRIAVILMALMGYVILGLFIYLLSRKIDKRF